MRKNIIIKIIVSTLSIITSLLIIIFMIKSAIDNEAFNEYGFELDEKYLYFTYATLSMSICLIYNLIFSIRHNEENNESLFIGADMFSLFLLGYYAKTFFKALNKYGTSGFDSFNLILVLIFLTSTIYFTYKGIEEYFNNKHKA